MAAIAWLLAAIVALLFYRWVDRRHKVLLAKIAGVGILAVAGVAAIAFLRERAESAEREREREAIEIRVDSLKLSQLWVTICNQGTGMLQQVDFHVSGLLPGRSTPHPLEVAPQYTWQQYSEFSSDYNTSAGTCIGLTWEGSFRDDFNRFSTETTTVQFAPE
jgi:hypothetical protein